MLIRESESEKTYKFDVVRSDAKGKYHKDPYSNERLATVDEAATHASLYRKIDLNKEVELQDGIIRGTADGNIVVRELPSQKCE